MVHLFIFLMAVVWFFIQKLGSATPPPTSSASTQQSTTPSILQDSNRALTKVKKFLGALVQFSQDTSPDRGDRVRALILSLAVNFCFDCSHSKLILIWKIHFYRVGDCHLTNLRLLFKKQLIFHYDRMFYHFWKHIFLICKGTLPVWLGHAIRFV